MVGRGEGGLELTHGHDVPVWSNRFWQLVIDSNFHGRHACLFIILCDNVICMICGLRVGYGQNNVAR